MGLAVAVPLGFNNTYALAMRADDARSRNIARLSDLKAHPDVRLGLSQEFIGRADGWPGLKRTYELPFETPRGLDHGLAYEAIAQRQVDAIDIYSTDAKLDKYGLTVLDDDRKYFPRYDAVLLYRADLPQRLPKTWEALTKLQGTIDDAAMRRMNAAAELDNKDFATVAAGFLSQHPSRCVGAQREGRRLRPISGASSSAPTSGASRSSSWDSFFFRWRPASSSASRSGFSPRSVRRRKAGSSARPASCRRFPRSRSSPS